MNLGSLLLKIIKDDVLHIKWLNTLSYLENCGARKIAACEHPTLVKKEMLKHAAEEFRHAHHLKLQIRKLTSNIPPNYSFPYLLGGWNTIHYLNKLELAICRHYFSYHVYPLVTYAIEKRAQILYPLYHSLLKASKSSISVKCIALEEEEHLEEMEKAIDEFGKDVDKKFVCSLEDALFNNFMLKIDAEL